MSDFQNVIHEKDERYHGSRFHPGQPDAVEKEGQDSAATVEEKQQENDQEN